MISYSGKGHFSTKEFVGASLTTSGSHSGSDRFRDALRSAQTDAMDSLRRVTDKANIVGWNGYFLKIRWEIEFPGSKTYEYNPQLAVPAKSLWIFCIATLEVT